MMKQKLWISSYYIYEKILNQFLENVQYIEQYYPKNELDNIPDIMKKGIIHSFEITYQMARNLIEDYAEEYYGDEIYGVKDTLKYAFQEGLIVNKNLWDNINSDYGKIFLYTYQFDENSLNEMIQVVVNKYVIAFLEFKNIMEQKIILGK